MKRVIHTALRNYVVMLALSLLAIRFILPGVIAVLKFTLEALGSFGQGWH